MTPRYLVVHLPAFRLERTGYGADDVAALVAEEKSAIRLVALTPAARASGLRRGMTATEARALVPEVGLLPLDAEAEREDRRALLQTFGVLSDRVAFPWDDGVALEIGLVARALGGEEEASRRAVTLAEELGHRARAAVGDDPLAALAIAEWVASDGGAVVVPRGQAAPVLAPLPIQALRPDDELLGALRAVGIETIGPWAGLDPASVAGRYGPAALRLHRVARGGTAGPVLAVSEEEGLPIVRTALAGATTREEIRFVLPGLLSELAERLAAQDLAAVRIRVVLELDRPGAPSIAVSGRGGRPTRSVRALEQLVRTRLDGVEVEAPIDGLAIETVEAVPDTGWQPGLADRAEASEALPDLVARLSDQLGDPALVAPVIADSWRPEAAWRAERFPPPPRIRARRARPRPSLGPTLGEDPLEVQEAFEHGLPLPRPSLLLPKPERLEVDCEDGAPARVRLDHAWRSIDRRAGPERLAGEWWDRPFDREYWVIEVDGRTAWIYREAAEWALHGWFD